MFLHLKNYKVITAITYDIIMSIFSFYFAVCLRFETLYPFSGQVTKLPLFMSSIVISQIIYFRFMGLYRGIWRYSSVTDLSRIIKASVYGTLTPVVILFLWNRLEGFPRSIVIIDMLILIITLGGGRFIYRVWKDSRQQKKINLQFKDQNISNVIIIGAGSAGNQLLKEIINNNQLGLRVVGFVDDEVSKYGRTIQNVKVLGSSYELVNLVPKYNIKKIFIATPSATGDDLKRIINCCKETKVDF